MQIVKNTTILFDPNYLIHKILWIKNKQKKGLYRSKAPFNGFV